MKTAPPVMGRRFGNSLLTRTVRLPEARDSQQRTPLRRREPFIDDQAARDLDDVACCVSAYGGGNLTIRDLADREWSR